MMESETSSCVPTVHHHHTTAQHVTIGHLPTVQPLPTIRDPEWLKVEVCREFQRGMCKRTEDCRYAHPEKHIQVTEGKVIACFDALKGRCNRESCKYLHPTHLLKQHLEFAGRQTLINNRAMLQQMLPSNPANIMQSANTIQLGGGLVGYEQVASGNHHQQQQQQQQAALTAAGLHNMYGASGNTYSVLQPSSAAAQHLYNPNLISPQLVPLYQFTASPAGQQLSLAHHHPHHHHHHATPQVAAMLPSATGMRADKLEVCRDFQRGNCTRGEFECRYGHPQDRSMIDTTDNTVTVCMDCIKGRCTREKCKYFHPPAHLQAKIRAAQNPGASLLSSLAPAAIGSPQPVMLSNGNPLGQPPLKRQVMESSIISSTGGQASLQAPSPVVSHAGTPASLAALYGYSGLLPQALQHNQTPTYYQQDYVEVKDDKVTVCRDALQGVCVRPQCKFYHFPSSNSKLISVEPFQPQQQQQSGNNPFTTTQQQQQTSIDVMEQQFMNGMIDPTHHHFTLQPPTTPTM